MGGGINPQTLVSRSVHPCLCFRWNMKNHRKQSLHPYRSTNSFKDLTSCIIFYQAPCMITKDENSGNGKHSSPPPKRYEILNFFKVWVSINPQTFVFGSVNPYLCFRWNMKNHRNQSLHPNRSTNSFKDLTSCIIFYQVPCMITKDENSGNSRRSGPPPKRYKAGAT